MNVSGTSSVIIVVKAELPSTQVGQWPRGLPFDTFSLFEIIGYNRYCPGKSHIGRPPINKPHFTVCQLDWCLFDQGGPTLPGAHESWISFVRMRNRELSFTQTDITFFSDQSSFT
ncbi:hypothetical protein F2P81_011830 [Scophthalmus maximus]|uniref:Uncharacterized protein n=1 Tax=Scophthalmus maximus TaxID=52904 RepID=A0A6A4SWP9_SCOMX|nr:hypothetical protein F2P81_011830 [Scophthalmus maximus]